MGVDDAPAILDANVPFYIYLPGLWVYLNYGYVGPVGAGTTLRVVIATGADQTTFKLACEGLWL